MSNKKQIPPPPSNKYKWVYLNLSMFFEGQLDEGVLAVLVGTRLLVDRCRVQVDDDFSTAGRIMRERNEDKTIYYLYFVIANRKYCCVVTKQTSFLTMEILA